MIHDATFITLDPGHSKADKPHGMKAKHEESKTEHEQERIENHFLVRKGHLQKDLMR